MASAAKTTKHKRNWKKDKLAKNRAKKTRRKLAKLEKAGKTL